MVIYVNDKNEIKDVNVTADDSLTPLEITEDNPFEGWCVAKICCYCAEVNEGRVTMMTPYVDTRIIEHIDQLGKAHEENVEAIDEANVGLMETFEETVNNASSIEECNNALMELYEMIIGE